ncbi:GTP-binding protein REM 1-like [Penaeus chinensis]|uniref:GTP-binding protein REM 1-like n=1 Tax=Penaeus chinensis TaxID=139456 RepID=UPI001FB63DA1|nr:GTP-binding protein REM 1-like [Penaeus chinensis]
MTLNDEKELSKCKASGIEHFEKWRLENHGITLCPGVTPRRNSRLDASLRIGEKECRRFRIREGHADGWVVVYAINDRESFKTASTVLGRVWSLGHVTQRAVILVANKTDLQRTRVVTTSEGRTLAMTYECKFIEVSAGIDHNVDELLVGILTQIRLKNQVLSSENQEAPGSAPEGSPTATQQRTRHKNSFRVKGILNKLLNKDRKTKSCENLHVL